MRARSVVVRGAGGPEVLAIEERDVRDPGPGEVRVAVVASGVNRADVLQRRGLYPAPPGVAPDVLGLEYAGHVEAIGEGVSSLREGDAVMGILGGGAMCERVIAHEREVIGAPKGASMIDAAAIPEAFATAWDALDAQARLGAGEVLLVHAAASGVGTAAAQLGRAIGARVIGTTRTEAKAERLRAERLYDEVLVVPAGEFANDVARASGGRGADVVLDFVGAPYLAENVAAMAAGGRMVVLGLLGGASGALPLGAMMGKRLSIRASTLRARPLEEKAALARELSRRCVPLFERGALRALVDCEMEVERVAEAHARMEANDTLGKIVLRW